MFACTARGVLRREVEEEHQAGGRLGASRREVRDRESVRVEGARPERRGCEARHAGDCEVVLLRRRRSPLRRGGGGVRRQDARDVLPRERGLVAGLDGAAGAYAPVLPPPRLEVEAQLLASRGRRAGVRVAAAQRRGTARILRREWDSTWRNPHGGGHQTPVFAGLPAVRRRTSGTARVEKPAFSGLPGIAMKNGGMKSTETFSRTLAATRIFEHYELTSMRSGMVVK